MRLAPSPTTEGHGMPLALCTRLQAMSLEISFLRSPDLNIHIEPLALHALDVMDFPVISSYIETVMHDAGALQRTPQTARGRRR